MFAWVNDTNNSIEFQSPEREEKGEGSRVTVLPRPLIDVRDDYERCEQQSERLGF